mgnify:CR=1 FL=1
MASINGTYSKIANKNDEIMLYDCIAEDILDPSTNISFTVLCNGHNCYSKDGILLKDIFLKNGKNGYFIKLTEYGTYSLVYSINDESGNVNTLTQQILVLSYEKPTIRLEQDIKTKFNIGSSYVVPQAVSIDYEGKSIKTIYIITDPKGKRIGDDLDKNIVFELTGDYIIRYYAIDSLGNFNEMSFVLKVS